MLKLFQEPQPADLVIGHEPEVGKTTIALIREDRMMETKAKF